PAINSVSYVIPEGRPLVVQAASSSQPFVASNMAVGPGYFSVLGMPLLAGREFARGGPPSPPGGVLITQYLAAQLWPGQSAVGRTLRVVGAPQTLQVIGVTPNGVFSRYQREQRANYVFRSADEEPVRPGFGYLSMYVRYSG